MQAVRNKPCRPGVTWKWLRLAGLTGLLAIAVVTWSRPEVTDDHGIRVMTYNIGGLMTNQARLLALIKEQRPDLVLLQELRHSRQLRWLATQLHLPYQHFARYGNASHAGVGILSRWPLGPRHVLVFEAGSMGRAALAAQVHIGQTTVWACSVHLESPRVEEFGHSVWQHGRFLWREFFTATPRYHQAQELNAWLQQFAHGTRVVGGDFNSLPWSRVDRYVSQHLQDALAGAPWHYLTGTYWKVPFLAMSPRIDFLYHSSEVRVRAARVVRQKVSDHYPIMTLLTSPPAAPEPIPTLLVERHISSDVPPASTPSDMEQASAPGGPQSALGLVY
jgi:endonuclease/exonuclease/phosphatase (EEP) superfamily protein YafD